MILFKQIRMRVKVMMMTKMRLVNTIELDPLDIRLKIL
jgi:hypothetical protein